TQAESEKVKQPMKMIVNVKDLIGKIKSFVDEQQAKHDAAVEAFNTQGTGIVELVKANEVSVLKYWGRKVGSKLSDDDLATTANQIRANLGLPPSAPLEPGTLVAAKKQLVTLGLVSTDTLEIEDNSPYLQYVS